jgi:dephospho-CoA kinase
MGSGKDSVAEYLFQKHNFSIFSFAKRLKEIAKDLFPEHFADGGKPRKLLQDLGFKMREIEKDCWTNYVMRQVESWHGNIVITDCRYLNEIQIAQEHDFIPVRVECSDENRYARMLKRDGTVHQGTYRHPSETELDTVEIKHKLDNNGDISFLYKQIDSLIKELSD